MKRFLTAILLVLCVTPSWAACGGGANKGMDYGAGANYDILGNGESYTEIVEKPFVQTSENPSSYFSIDANTASYPNLRSLIKNNFRIDKDAVRVEEMLNYFTYDYATPTSGDILALTSSVFDTPYNNDTKMLTIGLAAQEVSFSEQSNNIVFLIDTSGSMYGEDRLGLVQQSFMMLAEHLNEDDRVSIVTYAGSDSVALEGAYGYEKQKIMAVIEDLSASGSTAGSEGIKTAYQIAEKYFIPGGNNRVILATDGDFNVGITGTGALETFISEKRASDVYFSVFGVGRGNIQSDKMETLALNGNGTYSYIDSVKEAKRALVEQIGGTMLTVAKDVKAGVTFNPEYVESYRLIGYENKQLSQEEFEDENTDAGELGSGHTITVVYEIKTTEKAFVQTDSFAQVVVKYKPTENSVGTDITQPKETVMNISTNAYHTILTQTDSFVASVVEFALLLRNSEYKANADLNALITRLDDLDLSEDEFKSEFRDLVKQHRTNTENVQN